MPVTRLFFAFILCLASLLALGAPLQAAQSPPDIMSGTDHPGGPFAYVLVQEPRTAFDPAWAVRTGIRKGVYSQTVEDEVVAGPDVAILKSGLYSQWPAILTGFQEASTTVEPWDIGGLVRTKPVLIIPSGGLSGLSDSRFFKAGLRAYVEAGGVIVVMSQRKGSDFSILPVPEGSQMTGAGWLEDAAAFFRASSLQSAHPSLAGIRTTRPAIETHGYVNAYPPGSTLLLAHADGNSTALLYPLGKGWVVVTTLFSDFLSSQRTLATDEKNLLRDLIAWAKAPASITTVSPGDVVTTTLTIRGPETGNAASVKILIKGPNRARPIAEQVSPLTIKAGESQTIPFKYSVSANLQPGIHHLEYILLDEKGLAVSSLAETLEGRFYLASPALAETIKQTSKFDIAAPLRLGLAPSLEKRGETAILTLEISRESKGPAQDLFVRVADKEKSLILAQDKAVLSFELPWSENAEIIGAAVYDSQGRSLIRATIPMDMRDKSGVAMNRPFYTPGTAAQVLARDMGKGELSVIGAGAMTNAMITGSGSLDLTIPSPLPLGIYPVLWEFQSISAPLASGELPVHVAGYSAIIEDVAISRKAERKASELSATFRLRSGHAFKGILRVWLRSPDGRVTEAGEESLDVTQGMQEILFSFPFSPSLQGIWNLQYAIFATAPEGPGMPALPIFIAGGRRLIDSGDAAILGITTTAPGYYEPAGARDATLHVAGSGKIRIDLEVDGKRAAREKREINEYSDITLPLSQLPQGRRRITAIVTGDAGESKASRDYIWNAPA